jgi:hypothetical protein
MMKILTCVLAMATAMAGLAAPALAAPASTEQTIVALERRGMDGWLQGNPDEFLKISDPEITYFHSALGLRLSGLPAVKALCEGYRGRPLFDRYEMLDPRVVVSGNVAILTYEFTTQNGTLTRRWHTTEVYREGPAGWRIIHSHFSQTASAS